MLYYVNMKSAMFIVLTVMLTLTLSGISYAKSGEHDIASDMADYINQRDNVATLHSKYARSINYDENLECEKNVEHSCQTFGALTDKFIYSHYNNNSAKDIHHSYLRAQISFLEFIKPPRT